jgi:hypothetical protein
MQECADVLDVVQLQTLLQDLVGTLPGQVTDQVLDPRQLGSAHAECGDAHAQ